MCTLTYGHTLEIEYLRFSIIKYLGECHQQVAQQQEEQPGSQDAKCLGLHQAKTKNKLDYYLLFFSQTSFSVYVSYIFYFINIGI